MKKNPEPNSRLKSETRLWGSLFYQPFDKLRAQVGDSVPAFPINLHAEVDRDFYFFNLFQAPRLVAASLPKMSCIHYTIYRFSGKRRSKEAPMSEKGKGILGKLMRYAITVIFLVIAFIALSVIRYKYLDRPSDPSANPVAVESKQVK